MSDDEFPDEESFELRFLRDDEKASVRNMAKFLPRDMIKAKLFYERALGPQEERDFEEAFLAGAADGVMSVMQELFNSAVHDHDVRAADKYLTQRNLDAGDATQAVPPLQVHTAKKRDDDEKGQKVVELFPSKGK